MLDQKTAPRVFNFQTCLHWASSNVAVTACFSMLVLVPTFFFAPGTYDYSLYLPICVSNFWASSIVCDLSSSIDLRIVVDFQLFSIFFILVVSAEVTVSKLFACQIRKWKSPHCPSSPTTSPSTPWLYVCISRSFIYLGMKLLSHRVCLSSNLLHNAKMISKVFVPICHPMKGMRIPVTLYISRSIQYP